MWPFLTWFQWASTQDPSTIVAVAWMIFWPALLFAIVWVLVSLAHLLSPALPQLGFGRYRLASLRAPARRFALRISVVLIALFVVWSQYPLLAGPGLLYRHGVLQAQPPEVAVVSTAMDPARLLIDKCRLELGTYERLENGGGASPWYLTCRLSAGTAGIGVHDLMVFADYQGLNPHGSASLVRSPNQLVSPGTSRRVSLIASYVPWLIHHVNVASASFAD